MEKEINEELLTEQNRKMLEIQREIQIQAEIESALQGFNSSNMASYQRYQPSPREYLHQFLLQAMQSGCNVESHIREEIEQMKRELSR